jgi:uroporphyrinogen decarboxylase
MSEECVFAELGMAEDWHRLQHDAEYRVGLRRRYNDAAEKIVGRRLLSDRPPNPEMQWPTVKELRDIFEGRNVWRNGSYWFEQVTGDVAGLERLLDRVEARLGNLRVFILPPRWAEEKARITGLGGKVPLYRGQRGPVTFAMSVFGVENTVFLIMDNPGLAGRFRDLILRAMLERARILDEEAGYTPATAPRGFYFCDDNCCMLNAEMYEFFGYPVLEGVFGRYSPAPGDMRGQHSDSDMGHLLPLLGRLGMTTVNFGPRLTVAEIREHLPGAVIHGQLAPFTLSRNEEVNRVAEAIRDFEMARAKRGLVFATAGSINNGSRLTGMRLLMAATQQFGRYA